MNHYWHTGAPKNTKKTTQRGANRLKELGYKNVNYSLVQGCRHEIFNETKRDEVFDSFINWLNNVVNVN